VPLGGIHRPLIQVVGRGKQRGSSAPPGGKKQSINPFVILTYPDIAVTLIFTGVIYSVQYTILANISSSFADVYPWLSETLLGVSYLPTGLGMIVGTYATGRLLDMEYARAKRNHVNGQFPKEVARLRTMPFHVLVFVVIVVGWGLCLGKAVHIAVPLVLSAISECTTVLQDTKLLTAYSWMVRHGYTQHHHDTNHRRASIPQFRGHSLCKTTSWGSSGCDWLT
jgi:predicted MFS family arabinose efflux permease